MNKKNFASSQINSLEIRKNNQYNGLSYLFLSISILLFIIYPQFALILFIFSLIWVFQQKSKYQLYIEKRDGSCEIIESSEKTELEILFKELKKEIQVQKKSVVFL
ncbi:MAG: hypothetical protein EAZ55_14320 [Cytophagales bacterium]|nr:MAG: hypothetical protein EAZ55_14320 [Cytophagales bacterium]